MACPKRQRSLAFSSCKSVGMFFLRCFLGTKMHITSLKNHLDLLITMNINVYNHCLACPKQQMSLAFSSCKSVGMFFPRCFLGTKMHITSLKNHLDLLIMMTINVCNHCLACLKQQMSLAFSSCKSVGLISPGVSWALNCTLFPLIKNHFLLNNEGSK